MRPVETASWYAGFRLNVNLNNVLYLSYNRDSLNLSKIDAILSLYMSIRLNAFNKNVGNGPTQRPMRHRPFCSTTPKLGRGRIWGSQVVILIMLRANALAGVGPLGQLGSVASSVTPPLLLAQPCHC